MGYRTALVLEPFAAVWALKDFKGIIGKLLLLLLLLLSLFVVSRWRCRCLGSRAGFFLRKYDGPRHTSYFRWLAISSDPEGQSWNDKPPGWS